MLRAPSASLLLALFAPCQDRDLLAPAAGANRLSDAERSAGWRLLFDGESTNGWRGFKKHAFPEKGWSVDGGALHVHADGGGGDIVTVDQFTSFELAFEWKVSAGANSGVMYRVSEREAYAWRTGPECQVLDDAKHPDGKDPRTAAGSLYAMASGEKTLRPVGEWNAARIVLDGQHLEHWLNGKKLVDIEVGGERWNELVAASKFKSMPGFGKEKRGHICLQDHGNDVWFRALKVRELGKQPEKVVLFDGKSLAGWTAHLNDSGKLEDVFKIVDGVLVDGGTPAGYLRTEREFKDFVLRVVWRWSPVTKATGNSGVLVRMIGADKVWPKSIEAQLQHENAGDFWNIDEFTMQPDPARTKGRNTKKLRMAEKPAGEWNEYEIVCDGPTVTLKVNGQVLNVARECAEVAGRICLQSEGCEIQFREVVVAPIER